MAAEAVDPVADQLTRRGVAHLHVAERADLGDLAKPAPVRVVRPDLDAPRVRHHRPLLPAGMGVGVVAVPRPPGPARRGADPGLVAAAAPGTGDAQRRAPARVPPPLGTAPPQS